MTNDKLSGIDMIKIVAAVLVLLSHVGVLGTYSNTADMWFINIVFRWCIPFFFVCNGFFMPHTGGGYKKYIFKIIIMYLIWTMFYTLYGQYSINKEYVKNVMFNGIIPAFWYFPSLILCISFCYFLSRVIEPFGMCVITMMLYMVALLGDTYSNVNPMAVGLQESILMYHYKIFNYTTRDGFLFGSFYICLGNFLQQHKEIIDKMGYSKKYRIKLGIIIFITWIFEAFEIYIAKIYNLGADINVLISTIPLSVLIFIFAYNIKINRKVSLLLRQFSTLIWLIHPWVISVLTNNIQNSVARFTAVLTVTLVLAAGLIVMSSRIRVLKILY